MYETARKRSGRDPFDALVDVLAAVNRYDFVLGIIPIAFVVALSAASVLSLPIMHALLIAAIIGVITIVDACYLNPPVGRGST
ncbi:hypothetical protein CV102_05855 [Natronococcus pandeyae]|uniref:Uncharacterized protein n=1 Tax=Natronococcus pandeyae TaxID=2055836 RepID=A0A8J8Q6Q8_9EURY|nr:hypothetical protein [Natronococcus pandeyae]TYL39807.1 hypothetical protein CV102_05855 [Natronococcus pandeyae]